MGIKHSTGETDFSEGDFEVSCTCVFVLFYDLMRDERRYQSLAEFVRIIDVPRIVFWNVK